MTRIDERKKILEAKLREMSEDGVMKSEPKETLSFDPPDEDEDDEPHDRARVKPSPEEIHIPKETEREKTREVLCETQTFTLDDYRSRYLVSVRIREKTAFTMNVETLQVLKNVLQDLGERIAMASYIDNILREHLKAYKELLNNATAKQRRKTTITL